MSAATMMFGPDRAQSRQAMAFSASMVMHIAFAIFILFLAERPIPEPPLEVSIFEGPKGPASPPPGEKSAAPGPVAPAPEPQKVEAPKAPQVVQKQVRAPQPKTVVKPVPVAKPVQDQGLLAALSKGPAPTTQAFEGVNSPVQLREAPVESSSPTGSTLGTARSKADVSAGSTISSGGPAVSGNLGSSVGSVVLPGPGGGGSGWNSGSGGGGAGGGGTGRGGFSVSGAGAGGAGRSYASIWEWTQRYLAGLRWAYNNELRTNPGLKGVIVVRYEILANGSVGSVQMVSSQMHDPGLEQTVLSQIRGWHYPPEPSGTVVVTWPFSFLPPS